jgi:hypothetical protein
MAFSRNRQPIGRKTRYQSIKDSNTLTKGKREINALGGVGASPQCFFTFALPRLWEPSDAASLAIIMFIEA